MTGSVRVVMLMGGSPPTVCRFRTVRVCRETTATLRPNYVAVVGNAAFSSAEVLRVYMVHHELSWERFMFFVGNFSRLASLFTFSNIFFAYCVNTFFLRCVRRR